MIQNQLKYRLILASGSPRRKELMEQMGLKFRVQKTNVEEHYPENLVEEEVALYLANQKAAYFSNLEEDELCITSDTIVCLNHEILNKPADRAEAMEMLRKLSGKEHKVITAVSLKSNLKQHSFYASTSVFFKLLKEDEMAYYVDNFHPYDKAGGYGIQEWIGLIGIEKIEGSYFNVVGLPVFELYQALVKF